MAEARPPRWLAAGIVALLAACRGRDAPPADPPDVDLLAGLSRTPQALAGQTRDAVVVEPGVPLEVSAELACGRQLVVSVAARAPAGRTAAASFRGILVQGDRRTEVFHVRLAPDEARVWNDVLVPPPSACGPGRLELLASWEGLHEKMPGRRPGPTKGHRLIPLPRGLMWSEIRVAQTTERRIAVFLQDTLRADVVGAYGGLHVATPHLDRLSREGTTFARALAASTWTRSSVGSLFTSRLPYEHGALGYQDVLAPAQRTLAEAVASTGARASAVVSNGNIGFPSLGFRQGFHRWWMVEGAGLSKTRGERVVAALSAHLAAPSSRRELLYVHAVDPHAPYAPLPPFDSLWETPAGAVVDGSIDGVCGYDAPRSEADVIHLRNLYAAEVLYGDHQLGRVRALLGRCPGELTTFFLSDHGESFGEHQRWHHGTSVNDPELQVPLVAAGPPFPAGRLDPRSVSLMDVAPTVLSLLGAPAEPAFTGERLWPPGPKPRRPVRATHVLMGTELVTWEEGRRKAILSLSPVASLSIHDVDQDPGEHWNLGWDPRPARDLRELVARARPGYAVVVEGAEPGDVIAADAEAGILQACMGCQLSPGARLAVTVQSAQPPIVLVLRRPPEPLALTVTRGERVLLRAEAASPCPKGTQRAASGVRVTLRCRASAAGDAPGMSDAERDALRALGYLQ